MNCLEVIYKIKLEEECAYIYKLHYKQIQKNFKTNFEESVWASIKLVDCDELLIGCIYRSSGGNDTNNDNLLKLLLEINKAKYNHVL